MRILEILPYVSPQAVHRAVFDAAPGHELNAVDWAMIAVLCIAFGTAAIVAFHRHLRDNARFAKYGRLEPRPSITEPYVWVNTRTRVYFAEGHRWFKRTREGAIVRLSTAIASGCRASRV